MKLQQLLSRVRKAVDDYQMIEAGDKIGVGVSGGKDSLALLVFLAELRKYNHNPFEVEAITIDMGLGMDFSGKYGFLRFLWLFSGSFCPSSPRNGRSGRRHPYRFPYNRSGTG